MDKNMDNYMGIGFIVTFISMSMMASIAVSLATGRVCSCTKCRNSIVANPAYGE